MLVAVTCFITSIYHCLIGLEKELSFQFSLEVIHWAPDLEQGGCETHLFTFVLWFFHFQCQYHVYQSRFSLQLSWHFHVNLKNNVLVNRDIST